jgi:negative regulator of sigma E activity
MNMHLSAEVISALIDNELGNDQLHQARAHLSTCLECSARLDSVRSVVTMVGGLPAVEPSPYESAEIRKAVAENSIRAPWFNRVPRLAWAAAALMIIIAGVAFVRFSSEHHNSAIQATSLSARPGAASSGTEVVIVSADDAKSLVTRRPEYSDSTGKYKVKDVASAQTRALGALAPQAHVGDESKAESSAGSSGNLHNATAQLTQVEISACLQSVLNTQPYPMVPIIALAAQYQSTPAYLLVYAWTPSRESDAVLDQIQIWIVDLSCRTLSYSSFKRSQA